MEINSFGSHWFYKRRKKLIYGSYEQKVNGEGEFWGNGMQQTKEGGFSTFLFIDLECYVLIILFLLRPRERIDWFS